MSSTRGGMAAGDLDNDGFLDLYLAAWGGESHLFFNEGDGTFSDESQDSGVLNGAGLLQWQPMMHDFDADGWLDLFIAVDVDENLLFLNQGDRTFVDVGVSAGVGNLMNDMGLSLGDFDRDGDFDAYFTNITNHTELEEHNVLYRNDSSAGTLQFTEISEEQGVDQGGWGWGTGFWDFDDDGDLDLAATNGWQDEWEDDQTLLWLNKGAGPQWFSANVAPQAGLADTEWGSALVSLDFDRDGDLDLVQPTKHAGLRLLQNLPRPAREGTAGHSICIAPRMRGNNYRAIGAVVSVMHGGQAQGQLIHAGTSLQGQEAAEAHFGLGTATQIDTLTVQFPDGRVTTLESLPMGAWPYEVAPAPFTDHRVEHGDRRRGGLSSLWDSDDQRVVVEGREDGAGFGSSLRTGWVIAGSPSTLEIQVESAASSGRVQERVELYDWSQGTWREVGSWSVERKERAFRC